MGTREAIMKKRDRIIVPALITLVLAIIFFTIRNDIRFNDCRERDAKEIEQRDIFSHKRQDSLSTILNEIADRVDSLLSTQEEHVETERLNQEAVQESLNQIKSTQRRLLKATK